MKLAGFNFTKVHAEKSEKIPSKEVNVKTNIDIAEINEIKSNFVNSNEKLVGVKFNYNIEYTPEFAKISFKGTCVFSIDANDANDVIKQWNEKKIHEQFKTPLFNTILKKSNFKALQLEEELNLPHHIPMPSIKSEAPKKE